MIVEFDNAKQGAIRIRQVLDGKRKLIGHMNPTDDGNYTLTIAQGATVTEPAIAVIEEKFLAYIERQALKEEPTEELEESSEPVTIYRPEPCPEQGTAGIEYMEWAGEHMEDAEFRELYDYRWTQPKFRTYAAPAVKFCQRAAEIFSAW
jgi:hypothetical protein